MQKLIAFDLEIATAIPEGIDDWSTLHPLGIACAGVWKSDDAAPQIFQSPPSVDRLSADEVYSLLQRLDAAVADGYTIVTVNGAAFDFRELAANLPALYKRNCATLAVGHFDLYFQVLCAKGYGPGLDAMAKGFGLFGKPEGMDGERAPLLWAEGKRDQVIAYLENDLALTLEIARLAEQMKEIRWITRKGKLATVAVGRLQDVATCNGYRLPNTSWMESPRTRESHIGWAVDAP